MTTVEILRKARDHIAQPGMWFQGGWFSPENYTGPEEDKPRCTAGAVFWAARGQPSETAMRALRRITEAGGFPYIGSWNDTPGRTQSEVVALFDRAIALAEREDAA